MIKAHVEIKLTWNIPPDGTGPFWQKLKVEINDAAKQAAQFYVYHLKSLLSIRVGRSATGKVIQRSLPGEAPRRETAELWRSISIHQDRIKFVTTIFTNVKYASELEHGTVKISPRPAWLPAFLGQWHFMSHYIRLRLALYLDNYRPYR